MKKGKERSKNEKDGDIFRWARIDFRGVGGEACAGGPTI
jgi:hypothetical protein